jgi:hypothetical protein
MRVVEYESRVECCPFCGMGVEVDVLEDHFLVHYINIDFHNANVTFRSLVCRDRLMDIPPTQSMHDEALSEIQFWLPHSARYEGPAPPQEFDFNVGGDGNGRVH